MFMANLEAEACGYRLGMVAVGNLALNVPQNLLST
jgi:hypothetical protein